MIRACVFREVGGYEAAMIDREDPECLRIRRAGHRILRLDQEMTLRDAPLFRFGHWFAWNRLVWSRSSGLIEYKGPTR